MRVDETFRSSRGRSHDELRRQRETAHLARGAVRLAAFSTRSACYVMSKHSGGRASENSRGKDGKGRRTFGKQRYAFIPPAGSSKLL